MSSKYQFFRAEIVDVVATGVEGSEREVLLDYFGYWMKTVARFKIREAVFETSDLSTACERGVAGFVLRIKRMPTDEGPVWTGEFTRGTQRLEVMGLLEDPDLD